MPGRSGKLFWAVAVVVSYGQRGTWILPKDHQLFDKLRWVSGPEAGKCQGADDTFVLLLLFVLKSCPTLCYPMDCSTLGFPVLHYLLELAETHIQWVSDAIQPSHPLLLSSPALVFPSIRVFSIELALCISISLSNEYSGLIYFRIDWFDLLDIQGGIKNLL